MSRSSKRTLRTWHAFSLPLVLAFGLAGGVALAPGVFAQTSPAGPPANRWLVIVETSKAMRSRAEAVAQIVPSMVNSGMKGQMRRGDTLGIWTYNESVARGQFPLQVMAPETSEKSAQHALEFLKKQKFEKKTDFAKVLSEMNQIITNSEFITVILITSGADKISGTPFDDSINEIYKAARKPQEKEKMPIVTLLRARRGEITDYAVALPPRALELPPLPQELHAPKVSPARRAPAPPAAVAPLIMSGSNVLSAPVTDDVPAVAPAAPKP